MANISDFLDQLASDDHLLHAFELHPKREMDKFGLDAEQQALVLGGDIADLRSAIQAETGSERVYMIKMRL